MTFRRSWLAPLLGGLIALLGLRFWSSSDPDNGASRSPSSGNQDGRGALPSTERNALNGKFRGRESKMEPGLSETFAALKQTIPGLTEFPEQTLQERILATNAVLKKAGIKLRFGVDEVLYPSQHLLDLEVPAFSGESATPNHLLRQCHQALNRHYFFSEGAVLFQDGSGG